MGQAGRAGFLGRDDQKEFPKTRCATTISLFIDTNAIQVHYAQSHRQNPLVCMRQLKVDERGMSGALCGSGTSKCDPRNQIRMEIITFIVGLADFAVITKVCDLVQDTD
jgi:hypothetical protein